MKRSRQKAILTILNQRRITTQEQLRDALLEQGGFYAELYNSQFVLE